MTTESTAVVRRITAVMLLAGSLLAGVGNGLHPHAAASSTASLMVAIAASDAWVPIHLAIIVAVLLIVGALSLATADFAPPAARALGRLGTVAGLIGTAVVTVSTTIDGLAMKSLADEALALGAPEPIAMAVIDSISVVGFGLWSIGMLVLFGIAFACFGAAVAASGRFPTWFGSLAVVGATGAAGAALLQLAANGEVQAAEDLFLLSSAGLTLWTFVLGLLVWRRDDHVPSTVPLRAAVPR